MKNKKFTLLKLKNIFYSFIVFFFIFSEQALASVDRPTGSLKLSNNYDSSLTRFSDANTFLTSLVDFFLNFVAIIAIIAIIYGGFLLLTSGGDEGAWDKGKTIILYTVLGIVLILASYAIVNTVINFGTGSEGIKKGGTVAGSIRGINSSSEYSDNPTIIKAGLKASPTTGTLPLIVNFDTEGSFDLSNKGTNNIYWDFQDGTRIAGILALSGDKTTFKLSGQQDIPVIISTGLVANSISSCGDGKFCFDLKAEQTNHVITQVLNARSVYGEEKNAVIEKMITSKTYPILIYGKKRKFTENNDQFLTLVETPKQNIEVGEEVIEVLDPGDDGYALTILNPYGLELGGMQQHKYTSYNRGNYMPRVFIVNDNGTPLYPDDDLKARNSVLIKVSKDNIDPLSIPPTAAFIYTFDPDDPKKVSFKNVSLDEKGVPILSGSEAIIPNGIEIPEQPYYFEWDFDLEKDSNGDENKANDNDFVQSDIKNFKLNRFSKGEAAFSFETIDGTNGTNLKLEMRNAGESTYKELSARVMPNYLSAVQTFDPPLSRDQIMFFRIKASDGTFSKEIKVKFYTNKDPEIIYQNDDVYHVYNANATKVKIKLLVKNLENQNYDNSVREINLPLGPLTVKTPPTALFAYKIIPGTSKVIFYNDSYHADGNRLNKYKTAGSNTTIKTGTKDYSFSWDFDTKQEFEDLLIQPEGFETSSSVKPDGTIINEIELNSYIKDSVSDNDINTVYNALGNGTNPFSNGIVVNFPDKDTTYNVKLTVYDITDVQDPLLTELFDSRTVSIKIPKAVEKPRPVANFSYKFKANGNSAPSIYFQNLSKAYYTKENKYYYISNGFEQGSEGYNDLNPTNFDVYWDLDLKKDSDNDGDPENDQDLIKGFSGDFTSTTKDPKDVKINTDIPAFDVKEYAEEFLKEPGKSYEVKLVIQEKNDYKKKNEFVQNIYIPTFEELANSIESPVAAFLYARPDGIAEISGGTTVSTDYSKFVKLQNKSRSINGIPISSADYSKYTFVWDINTEVDSDGDGTKDNDNDNSKIFQSKNNDPLTKYAYYPEYGKYKIKLKVSYKTSQNIIKTNSIIRSVQTAPLGTALTANPPTASFQFYETGDKKFQFFSNALDSNGNSISTTMVSLPTGAITPSPSYRPAGSFVLEWDFDLDLDSSGNNNKEDDNNFSTFFGANGPIKGIQGLTNPLRLYENYEDPAETRNVYGDYRVKLIVKDLSSGEQDVLTRKIKLNNPPKILRPIVDFTYSYPPVASGSPTIVSFRDNSTNLFGTPLDSNNYEVWFDFDLNTDTDKNTITDDDKDSNLLNNTNPPKPCIYQGTDQNDNKIHRCSFPKQGEFPVKLSLKNKRTGIITEKINVVYIEKKADPPAPVYPSNIPAFLFTQNPDKDTQITFVNKAMDSAGKPITTNITYDFDLSFDSNGDNNPVNDQDKVTDDNEIFKVLSGNPASSIVVEYKKYKTYDVKQTILMANQESITREVKIGPNMPPLPPLPMFTYNKNGSLVKFKNASIDGFGNSLNESTGYSFSWYFDYQGEASVSPDFTGFGPEFEYDYRNIPKSQDEQFGTFDARLVLSDETGNEYIFNRVINIANDSSNQDIRANIVATPKTGSAPLTVNFSSEGSKDNNGTIETIYWDFDGDGQPDNTDTSLANQTNITYTYDKPGHYRVGLAVQGPSGKAIAFTWISVYGDPPKATILIEKEFLKEDKKDPYVGFVGTAMNFEAVVEDKMGTDSTSYTWGWDFSDPNGTTTANDNSAIHIFSAPGKYEVMFTVTNNDTKLTTTAKRNLVIHQAPPIAKIITKELGNNQNQSGSDKKFMSGVASLTTGRFDVEFLASESTGSPTTSSCSGNNCFNDLVKISWDFGDGTETTEVSKDTSVKHSYSTPGTYLATLKVTDSSGVEGKATKTIFVADARKPIPDIQITPLESITGTPITFDATGSRSANGPIIEYTWQIGNAPFGTANSAVKLIGKIPKYSFKTPGTFDVSLFLKDRLGETTSVLLEDVLKIDSEAPIAKLEVKQKNSNIPNEFTLDASASADFDEGDRLTYIWNFGDSTPNQTSSSPTINHIYNEIGRYTVKVIVKDSYSKTSEASAVVRVDSLLRAKIENASPRAGKAPLSVNFSGKGGYNKNTGIDETPIVNYEWDFGDGTIENGVQMKTASHKYVKGGKYEVVLKVYDNEDNLAEANYIIYVGKADPAPIAIIEGPTTIESFRKVPINFNGFNSLTPDEVPDSDDNKVDLEYSWDFGDKTKIVSGDPAPIHTYTELGNYTVTLTVRDSLGRSSKDQVKVNIVKSRPSARFKATPAYGKSPLLVKFDASNSSDPDDNIENYIWKFDSQTSISTTQKVIEQPLQNKTQKPVTYNVNLKVVDKDGLSDIYILPVTVLPE